MVLIQQAAGDAGVTLQAGAEATVGDDSLSLDLRVADAPYAIEWVSPQDRVDHPALPEAPPAGQLRIVRTQDGVEVLLLDANLYRFSRERSAVHRGSASAADVDARVRRDVRDFLVYAGLVTSR